MKHVCLFEKKTIASCPHAKHSPWLLLYYITQGTLLVYKHFLGLKWHMPTAMTSYCSILSGQKQELERSVFKIPASPILSFVCFYLGNENHRYCKWLASGQLRKLGQSLSRYSGVFDPQSNILPNKAFWYWSILYTFIVLE